MPAVSTGSTAAGEGNSGATLSSAISGTGGQGSGVGAGSSGSGVNIGATGNAQVTVETPDANAIEANQMVSDTAVATAGQVANNALTISNADEIAGIQGVVDEADNQTAQNIAALNSQQQLAGSALAAQQTTSGQAIDSLQSALETNANLAATTVAQEEAESTLTVPAAQDIATSPVGQGSAASQNWQTLAAIASVALVAWYFLKGKPE
jgi:hypothetical protein